MAIKKRYCTSLARLLLLLLQSAGRPMSELNRLTAFRSGLYDADGRWHTGSGAGSLCLV
jgi:hypothetical protein